MTPALEIAGLRVVAGAVPLVRGVDLALMPGAAFTILGETGSGKSLLAQAVMGTLPPDLAAGGRIVLAGHALSAADAKDRRGLWGRRIALLPQEPWLALDPLMQAATQTAEVHRFLHGRPWAEARARAADSFAALGLAGAQDRAAFRLSGGMAQRAALAATRAGGAALLIADEPTKGLDAALRDTVGALLLAEIAAGRAVLTITHDVGLARALGGTVAVMLDGAFVEHGPAARVLATPSHAYTRRLLAAEPEAWPTVPHAPCGDTVLAASGLCMARGGQALFRDLDLAVGAGEVVAVTGASGCGKTTLGNILLGLLRADAGTVHRAKNLGAEKFQKLWQDPPSGFAPRQTLRRSLADVVARHRLDATRVAALLPRLGLAPALLDRLPAQVSGGELQRVALLRALLLRPAFLFADEPTSRLDPVTQQEVVGLLRETAAATGMALLLVTHDRAIAAKAASRSLALG